MIYIEIYSGIRLGELVALEWSDVDYNNGTLKISKSMQYLPGVGIFEKSPKTEKSKRIVSIPNSVLELLKIHKKYQNEERLKYGQLWKASNKIFTQWDGGCIYPNTPGAWFKKFINKNNLPPLTFHQLRHTNASLMIYEGVDVVTVSKRLGHAQTSTTINIYSHALQKSDRVASDKLETLLNRARDNEKKVL